MGKGLWAPGNDTQGPVTFVACCSVPPPVQVSVTVPPAVTALMERQFTVTVKVHCCVAPNQVAVQVTVVTPGGKSDPEGGLLVMVKFVLQTVGWNVTTRPAAERQAVTILDGH